MVTGVIKENAGPVFFFFLFKPVHAGGEKETEEMYASAIRARARDGIATHGTVGAYIRDFRASSKLFEMVVGSF